MTPGQLAARFTRIGKALKANITAAELESVKEAKELLVQRSSGTLSKKRLRMLGHPYARGLGARIMRLTGNIDPSIVNAQSGEFRRRWKVLRPTMTAGAIRSSVINTDPKAKYMMGTVSMVPRRLDLYVIARIRAKRRSRLEATIQKAFRA